jgi:hypothetical protein
LHVSKDDTEVFDSTPPLPLTTKTIPTAETPLLEIAKVVRSKNSGPFELTLDVMFDSAEAYYRVKSADLLTKALIKRLYRVEEDDIIFLGYFDPALAWKCTIKRPWAQGSVGERDTLGTQQHAPLLSVTIPAASSSASARVVLESEHAMSEMAKEWREPEFSAKVVEVA